MPPSPPGNDGNLNAQQMVPILEKWRKEMHCISREVTDAIGILDGIKKEYDRSKLKFLKEHVASITIIVVGSMLLTAALFVPCFDFDIGKVKLSKPCTCITKEG